MRTDLDAQAMQHELDEALLDYRHASERGLWLARKRVDAAIAALQSRLAAPVGDAKPVNSPLSLQAAQGSNDDLKDAMSLMEEVANAKTNGEAFGAVISYRHKIRLQALKAAPDAVRRETVEACAKVCEARADEHKYGPFWNSSNGKEAEDCAAAIRAMLKGE